MTDITRKRNDTTPITGVLRENGGVADLSQASGVQFFMRKSSDEPLKASGEASIIEGESGTVRYQLSPEEVDESGFFVAEWQVTYADSTIQTFPNEHYLTIEIEDDLS